MVDLGAYVGGSTAALAAGAWENEAFRASGQKVHGFDRYTLTPWHIEHYPDPGFKDGRPGDAFYGTVLITGSLYLAGQVLRLNREIPD